MANFSPVPILEGKYEITKSGILRNSKTKHVIKPVPNSNYRLHLHGKFVRFSRAFLLFNTFGGGGGFLPVPSFDYRYEISKKGVVRNAKTKKIIKSRKYCNIMIVCLRKNNGKTSFFSVNQLLWEVWGVIPERTSPSPVPVSLSKNAEHYYFPSMRKAAFFLSTKLFYSTHYIRTKFQARLSCIEGWNVRYKVPEERIMRHVSVINGDKDLRR